MINRENYLLVREFLDYTKTVKQRDTKTIHSYWVTLKHFLQWMDKRHVLEVEKIKPPFPEYMLHARNYQHVGEKPKEFKQLSPEWMARAVLHARIFLQWLQTSKGMKIKSAYIDTLEMRRSAGAQSKLTKREYWRLSDVEKIAALKPQSIAEKRDIAATCFIFLSGARVGAFVTLPFAAVDIEKSRIIQSPEIGVRTKNHKAAVTFLLPIESLMKPVREWHEYIAAHGGRDLLWYPAFKATIRMGENWDLEFERGGIEGDNHGRQATFKAGLKVLCDRAGVEYLSPHKLRHGHGVYGVKNAKDISELKAISQNLMHENIGITDGIYGKLADDDLSEIISKFGKGKKP